MSGYELSGNHRELYNGYYNYYPNADCANFVSQCVHKGGMATNNIWNPSESEWKVARDFFVYWGDRCGYALATNANIYPGNPVCWVNPVGSPTGHQMICTGKNANGVPVIDGHNPDCFRVPWTNWSGSHTIYTISIVDDDLHTCEGIGVTLNDSYGHYQSCKTCREEVYSSSHTVVNGRCTICGYNGPITVLE